MAYQNIASRRLLLSIIRPAQLQQLRLPPTSPTITSTIASSSTINLSLPARPASTTASHTDKTIVLEKPDKFRPPSHPQRLNRRPPRQYPGPPISPREREAQKTRRYPHMFPPEGSALHRFLTNRMIHVWISLGVLTLLATITLTQSFLTTSPFAHLVPPISSLPFHPLRYVSEWWNTIKLHTEYTSQRVGEKRRDGILDAQKRRLYRRAHGMEDLTKEEDEGVDVRGLVDWDDGLTPRERAQGGRWERRTGRMVLEEGGEVGDSLEAGGRVVVKEGPVGREMREVGLRSGEAEKEHMGLKDKFEGEGEVVAGARPEKRRVKRWFGIWE